MKRTFNTVAMLTLCLALGGVAMVNRARAADDAVSQHMVAEATLTAHFIAAALKAGMGKDEINAALTKVAAGSVISEFWISDEKGRIEFTNIPGADFKFPTDPADKTQAAPFAALLNGSKSVVVQGFQARELDAKLFKYVGVTGVDKRRIVQVGVSKAAPGNGRAADTAPPAPSGSALDDFYLRAGFVLDGSRPTRFKDQDCSSSSPAALYGCGDGRDGAPLSSLGDFGTRAGIDVGLGYTVTPALRLEAVVQHSPRITFKGRANFIQPTPRQDVSAELSTLTGMLAAYVDLPALGLPRVGPFSPFAGVGAGLSRIRIGDMRMEFAKTRTIVPGGRNTGFTWMATAGVAVSLGEKTTLDLAWRYTDYGDVETGSATGRIEYRDPSRSPKPLPLARTRAGLRRHGVVLSLRYAF